MNTTQEPAHKPIDWREGRRRRAWELHQQGWTQHKIAEALGVTQGAVSQWLTRAKQAGEAGLQTRKSTGAPPQLSWEQRTQLPRLLERGAPSFGFAGDVWTCERVAAVVAQQFGVRYHRSHIARLLHACGWSRQHPVLRAIQRVKFRPI